MEGNNNNNQSFRQFSDQLRLHGSNLANLSLNDSIWSVNHNSYAATKKPESRRNFDTRVGQGSDHKPNLVNNNNNSNVDDGWKFGLGQANMGIDLNGGFNKGVYSNQPHNINHNHNHNHNQYVNNFDMGLGKGEDRYNHEYGMINGGKLGGIKKNKEVKKEKNNNNNNNNINKDGSKSGVDKRFKSLPPSESLPRNETVGGYIFVCNNDTMEENLKRQLFGLPPRYRDSVRQITPGLPLFLYNYSNHQLHGIYEAASFGGTNIDPTAWEDKKNVGESRFPAQVRVHTRKLCEPLDEDSFRPILHHYDGPKFRLELSVPEALSLLDIFDEKKA